LARTARIVLPGFPHHVRQQGHNLQPVFVERQDFQFYIDTLAEWKLELGCKVYAFCLMTNHVHLIVDPGNSAENLGRLMKRIAGRYTRRINRLEQRSGTVWNGRYRSSPIDTDGYLMACSRYVELNPVRASMVASPGDYPWSSYRAKAAGLPCELLDEDPCFQALGGTRGERERRYRDFVASAVPDGEWDLLRGAVWRGQLTGNLRFRDLVSKRLGRRIDCRGPGRPGSAPNSMSGSEK